MGKLRKDRFYFKIVGIPDEEFEKSNFLKYYKKTESCPSHHIVIDSLRKLKQIRHRSHPICAAIESNSKESDAVTTYTSDMRYGKRKFYRYVNEQICRDDNQRLKRLMPFIRRATSQINYHGPETELVLYRGITLTRHQNAFFIPGKMFRFPGFTSATEDANVAQQFGTTLFAIYIPVRCAQVRSIANVSCFPEEAEWLFAPYSRFRVVENVGNVISLMSLDNIGDIRNDTDDASSSSDESVTSNDLFQVESDKEDIDED